ncbi:MAG: right-handed parallel beta-helix repeat-containing protein, partial [bacterium]|nr:right-handed parallel beta-helix repeat-containing protein [bacterium]
MITNSRNVTIRGFSIKGANNNGVYVFNSQQCKIVNNQIFSNAHYGVNINNTYSNEIRQNQIHDNYSAADDSDIYIQGESGDRNLILSNNIFNRSSALSRKFGIYINTGDLNTVSANNVHAYLNTDDRGVFLNNYAMSNNIINNRIYSNYDGIFVYNYSHYNSILTNENHDNSRYGIYLYWYVYYTKIYRNRIYNNMNNIGICLYDYAHYTEIINNVIFKNNNGIYGHDSLGYIYNNIIISNYNYGVNRNNNTLNVGYNVFYGNEFGPYYNLTGQAGNITAIDPLIDTITSFTIISPVSIAIDNATNYYSESFNGNGLDMGWKESGFTQARPTNYVHVWPIDKWTNTIMNALSIAGNNSIVECLPKPVGFFESVRITGKTNLILRSISWTNSRDNDSTIIYPFGYTRGVIITNSKNITVQGFTIKNASQAGIYIDQAISNKILNNKIKDNNYGIRLISNLNGHNYIASNEIFKESGSAQLYGIYITDNDRNTIYSNKIHNNWNYGVYIDNGNAERNVIKANDIYNNSISDDQEYGIYLFGNRDNLVISNSIHHGNYGIVVDSGNTHQIYRNMIHHFVNDGIYFNNTVSQSNFIVKNEIYSNNGFGLNVNSASAHYMNILTNQIYGNYRGMYLYGSDNVNINRNLFHDNLRTGANNMGIYLRNTSTNIRVINNTFYNNNCGLYIVESSRCQITNNIFLSHAGAGSYNGCALYGTSSGPCYYDYNVFWNNSRDTNSSTIFFAGPSNYHTPPVIDTVSTFDILSPTSICVDHAKIISGVSGTWSENGPDIGWHESGFAFTSFTNVVHIWPADVWTNSITNALKSAYATNNSIIECHPEAGSFFETVRISGLTNVILRSYDWTNSRDNTTTVIDSLYFSRAVTITNSKNITIIGFTVKNAADGIYITDSISNQILNNRIMDNSRSGVLITSNNTCYNTISSNSIFNEFGVQQDHGIRMLRSSFNLIFTNRIYNNTTNGIYMTGTCRSNIIKQNNICNLNTWNQDQGIRINDGVHNMIYNNHIFRHQLFGIYLTGASSTNGIIKNTVWSNNANEGIYLTGGNVRYNIIMSNEVHRMIQYDGICIDSGTYSTYNIIKRNLIHHNNRYGIYLYQANDNDVVNNTVYSNHGYAIYGNQSTFNVLNNIILSNGGYGIVRATSGTVSVGYNSLYGHSSGAWSAVNILPGNITNTSPMIDTTTSFIITSPLSSAIDTATNVFNESFQGNGLDMGWKESGFTANYVQVIPRGIWRANINDALLQTTNNCIVQCERKPGGYAESVKIRNLTNVILRTFDWTNNKDNSSTFVNGVTKDKAISIEDSKVITILGFSIINADKGIYVTNSYSNQIRHNRIYNNQTYGILIVSEIADYNVITSNRIYNPGTAYQDYGIWINDGDYNTVYSNQIYNQDSHGIRLNSTGGIPRNNRIVNNSIYDISGSVQNYGIILRAGQVNSITSNYIYNNISDGVYLDNSGATGSFSNCINNNYINDNGRYGVYLFSDNEDYNHIEANHIYNRNNLLWRQDAGIYNDSGDQNIIRSNYICRHDNYGIDLRNSARSNLILNNRICSNHNSYGILIYGTGAHYNRIMTNIIHDNPDNGVYINGGDFNITSRNLIYRNMSDAIRIHNTLNDSFSNQVINNTLYKNAGNGIYGSVNCNFNAVNNIIFSNTGYGVRQDAGTRTSKIKYNIIYGNTSGVSNGGGIVYQYGNITCADPLRQPDIPCNISSAASPAVDNATNIPGTSDVYNGARPDMGWMESGFTNPAFLGPFYVDDDSGNDLNEGSFIRPFRTIQRAVHAMTPGVIYPRTYIFPGLYKEHIVISSNISTNILITGLSNTMPVLNGSLVTNYAFQITNASRITIRNLEIKNFAGSGIVIQGISTNITLASNTVCSNNLNGVFIDSALIHNNYLKYNQIGGFNQDNGIRVHDAYNNYILANNIFNNQLNGINLSGNASLNDIRNNNIFANNSNGIAVNSEGADNNIIISNRIHGPRQAAGIYIADADNTVIRKNDCNHQNYGIYLALSATNNYITLNNICSNNNDG